LTSVAPENSLMQSVSSPTSEDRSPRLSEVGIVAIGRNEGERLIRCLDGLPPGIKRAVYVDSGSTDGSVARARERGVDVVELDLSIPFTAARARNAGWRHLQQVGADPALIYFVDGDCEIAPGFLEAAVELLGRRAEVVAVCGWRRERHPEQTPYNTICDVEWRAGPAGEIRFFGGDVMVRADALATVGGYDDGLIAGEDPDLSVRLRAAGGRLERLDRVATIHDVAMTRARQWWTRATRCGHCYAQLSDIHDDNPERPFAHEARRSWLWGLALPAVAVGLAPSSLGLSLGLLGAYPAQAWRTYRGSRRAGFTPRESALWSASCTLAKLPESVGVLKYRLGKLMGRRSTLIEYKGSAP
jgi:GT2 family glycosyltransferase